LNEQQPHDQSPNSAPDSIPDNAAPLLKRIGAALIDLLLVGFFVSPLLYYFKLDSLAEHPFNVPPVMAFKVLGCEVFVFFVLNLGLLVTRGQTLGKLVFSLAIVDLNNQKPSILQLVVNRYFSQLVMVFVPFLNLLDVFMMLVRRDRRCLHDLLAKTRVVDLNVVVVAQPNRFVA